MTFKNSNFFFIGDQLLNSSHKQNGWKIKTDAQVNITYQVTDPKIKLTFIQIIVFQVKHFKSKYCIKY